MYIIIFLSYNLDDDVIFVPPPPKISRNEVCTPPPPSLTPPPPPSISSAADSLSIDETNKIRAKLGLKPLQMDNKETTKSRDDGLEVIAGDEGEFVHKPACNTHLNLRSIYSCINFLIFLII